MKTWLVVINNFAHDLFVGLWTSTTLVIYLLNRKLNLAEEMLVAPLSEVMKVFFWLGIFSLLVIIITGIIRMIHYQSTNSRASGAAKKNILIVKHLFLGAVLLAIRFVKRES